MENLMEDMIQDPVQDTQLATEVAPEPVVQPTKKEFDFKALRERAERAEQRASDLERHQQELKRSLEGPQQPEEDEYGVDDDLYIEGKQYKKHLKSIKNELKQTKMQLEQFNNHATELRLRSKYKDFDAVVTAENIAMLQQQRPSQFNALQYTPDLYDKGETAYEMIKSWVIKDNTADADARIAANRTKPRSAATAGPSMSDSPLAKFNDSDRFVMNDTERELTLQRLDAIKRR